MDSIDSWKILRVLTTNSCNYNCPFCHNEGQTKPIYQKEMIFKGKVRDITPYIEKALEKKGLL